MKSFEFCRNMWKSTNFLSNCKLMIEKKVKKPMKRFMQTVHPFLHEFCANSNIHGVRYFTERMLHWTERLWWIIAFGLSLWLCGSMIQDIWTEWYENPTIILNEKTHISMIPFPTVTICPQIKNLKHKLDISSKFDKKHKLINNVTDFEATQINALAHLCIILRSKIHLKDNFMNELTYDVIEEMAPSLEYTFQECRWQQKKINCSEYITPTMTGIGLCFTLNAFNSNDIFTDKVVTRSMIAKTNRNVSGWSMESGYKNEYTETEYPVRVLDSGREGALELVLSTNTQDRDVICNGFFQGYMLFLSAPGYSLETHNSLLIDISEDNLITVKPILFNTIKQLRSYKPVQRDCYFNSERRLHFFKSYTQHNCLIECMANFTKRECNCAIFSMPRDASTKICGAAKIECYRRAELQFTDNHESSFRHECNCLPSCTSIEYEVEIDRAKFNVSNVRKAQINDIGYQQTRLTIYFDENYIETKKRVERYTISDFLAICGGLLGLFLGISALSIIELIYFWSLRLFGIFYWSRSKRKEELSERKENELLRDDREDIINEHFLTRTMRYFRVFFTELCDDSNIHGFRYFSERGLHLSERLLWLIAFGVSLWLCSSMIHSAWIQWLDDPVTMSWTDKTLFTESIPFPTVTICPEVKTMKRKLDITAAIDSLSNLSDIEMTRLSALAHLCPILPHKITYKDSFANESIYDIVQNIAPNLRWSILTCVWLHIEKYCSELFTPVLTEEGLCFSFNALNSHEIYTDEMAPGMMIVKNNLNASGWDLEGRYSKDNTETYYPFQLQKGNSLLSILATDPKDVEYQCRGYDNGFKLILTMPGEAVDTSQNYLRLSISDQNIVEIHPKLTITSDGLRKYKPNQRRCFYSSDHPLRFFKMYTKKNCESECVANFTRIECGCVKLSMPRDNNTKICGGANIKCYKLARWNLFTSRRGESFRDKCNCLSSCVSIEYKTKIQRTTFNHTSFEQISLLKKQSFSIFALTFKAKSIETLKRKEMYSFSDFLAVCGGVLGLFLGVSFLSIIELIYYFTLRLFCTTKMKRNQFY